ncbi:MAG: hypothetical protein OEQ90_06525 [Gammaproteobacteria bacterium]|nr:hypothetical protein [Gammaproteobacteria bacterium]
MEYQGPTADDLANIEALNRFFLGVVSESDAAVFAGIAARRLTEKQRLWLASAPFLLFSLREQDNDYWQHILTDDPQIDLIDNGDPPDQRIGQLQMAALGFLWQLVRRNPYAARIISGAPVSWCEQLAGFTLLSLLQRAAPRGDLLCIRFPDEDNLWRRLLGHGVSSRRQIRLTSHHSALQAMLTRRQEPHYDRLSAAACTMQTPGQRDVRPRAVDIRSRQV